MTAATPNRTFEVLKAEDTGARIGVVHPPNRTFEVLKAVQSLRSGTRFVHPPNRTFEVLKVPGDAWCRRPDGS